MPSKKERRMGRLLVSLVSDDDKWDVCHAVLMEREERRRRSLDHVVWLDAKSGGGDSLVHLASSFACWGPSLFHKRLCALRCLELLPMQADTAASRRAADDGGTALHAAIAAAAATSDMTMMMAAAAAQGEDKEEEDDDDDDEEEEDDEEEDEWEDVDDDDDNQNDDDDDDDWTDQQLLLQFLPKGDAAAQEAACEADLKELKRVSAQHTDEHWFFVTCTISILLNGGASSTVPLLPAVRGKEEEEEEEDNEEVDATYSREAIQGQWSPLTMLLSWLVSTAAAASVSFLSPQSDHWKLPLHVLTMIRKLEREDTNVFLAPIGATQDWNAWEFVASCSAILSRCQVDTVTPGPKQPANNLFQTILQQMSIHDESTKVPLLSPLQSCLVALFCNQVETAQEWLLGLETHDQEKDDVLELRRVFVSQHLPLPLVVWGPREDWTVLEATAFLKAVDSVCFLLTRETMETNALTLDEAMHVIQCTFRPTPEAASRNPQQAAARKNKDKDDDDNDNDDNNKDKSKDSSFQREMKICKAVVDAYCSTPTEVPEEERRQVLLDKLLLHACAEPWGESENVLSILLRLGADAQCASVAHSIQGGYSVLHVIAANRHAGGTTAIRQLLQAGASPLVANDQGETPLDTALRYSNHGVAELLWKSMQNVNHGGVEDVPLPDGLALGLAAIDVSSLPMLKDAVHGLVAQRVGQVESGDQKQGSAAVVVSNELGQLLMRLLDTSSAARDKEWVQEAALLILQRACSKDCPLRVIPSFLRDKTCKYSPLHFLLRQEAAQGRECREALVEPLCQWAHECERLQSEHKLPELSKLVSLPCAKTKGGHTALHMAYALGCDFSVETLLRFGADETRRDGQGRTPSQLRGAGL